MRIFLNGNTYHLVPNTSVTRTPMVEWPDNTRLDGQQKRKDRRLLSSLAIDRWSNGLGLERMNVDVISNQYRLWDVENCDTRYPSHIIRSPEFQTCTIVPSRADLALHMDYIGELYFVETEHSTTTASENVGIPEMGYAYQFTPPFTIGSYRTLMSSRFFGQTNQKTIGSTVAIKDFGGKIAAIMWGGIVPSGGAPGATLGPRLVTVSTLGAQMDGTTWAGAESMGGTYHITRFSHIVELGGTIHVLDYRDDEKVHFSILDQAFANIDEVKAEPVTVGTYLAPLISDGATVYANLPLGVYNFQAIPQIVVDTDRARDKNNAMTLFQNQIYFKNKKALLKYDGTDIESIGYDREDGLPSDKWGEITAMASSWKYNFLAVQSDTFTNIFTQDVNNIIQYYARIPTTGVWVREMFLSDTPDGIDRLWCIFGSYGYMGYFLNPMVNPAQAATYAYVPTGHFTPPIFDGGMAEENGAFYDQIITADGIGANDKITSFYGLEGANPTVTLGVVATSPQQFIYGSPYGLEGYRIQPKFMLTGTSTSPNPKYRDSILHYLKIPGEREVFDFVIDLEETATIESRPLEAVIGSLNSERQQRVLIPFWYGQVATKAVQVLNMPALEDIEEDEIFSGERSGQIRVQLGEIL